jgi:hypothetical protein
LRARVVPAEMKGERMSRSIKFAVAAVTVVAMFVLAGPALAGSAKFHSATSSVNSAGALVVQWDQRGLGEGDINYTLDADATALYACINKGGHNPDAANKQSFEGAVTAGGTFEAKNGRVQGTLTAGPLPAPDFTCPGGQRRVLSSVTYTNIVLCDTTNNVCTDVPDTSRVLFPIPD